MDGQSPAYTGGYQYVPAQNTSNQPHQYLPNYPGIRNRALPVHVEPVFPPLGTIMYVSDRGPPLREEDAPIMRREDISPWDVPVTGYWCCACRVLHKRWTGISNRNDCPAKHECGSPNCGRVVLLNEWNGPVF